MNKHEILTKIKDIKQELFELESDRNNVGTDKVANFIELEMKKLEFKQESLELCLERIE